MNSAALSRAVIAYDEARCASHGPFEQPMSDRNRETIAPMILAAVEAYNSAPLDADAVAAALVILARRFNLPPDIQELLIAGNPQMGIPPGALAAALSSQSLSLSEAREDRDSWRRVAERCESEKQAAQATIKRMDRAASEANALYLKMSAERDAAREEIERLRGALLVVRPVVAGLIDAQYNVETWGLKGRLAKLDSELRRERVCEVCGGDCSAANPPPSYCPERDDFSALENGKARLADATSNPPLSDLSSLRKGAKVAALDVATRALNRIASRQEPHPVSAAFSAMTEIRALVSGSREVNTLPQPKP